MTPFKEPCYPPPPPQVTAKCRGKNEWASKRQGAAHTHLTVKQGAAAQECSGQDANHPLPSHPPPSVCPTCICLPPFPTHCQMHHFTVSKQLIGV
ncbi:hypothetical protein GN956_G9796 [Arapaima gigas]